MLSDRAERISAPFPAVGLIPDRQKYSPFPKIYAQICLYLVSCMSKTLILCIDTDVNNLNIRDIVLRQVGYDTLVATDANSGLRLFGNSEVSLVILDYELPDLNGGAVAREMRQLKPHIPILMHSARLFRPSGIDGEVDAYLTKGGSVQEFLEQIRCLLSPNKTVQSDQADLPALKRA